MSDIKSELLEFMRSHGVEPRDPSEIYPGELCRFALVDDKPGKKNGWVKYFEDGIPNARFKDWRKPFMDPIAWRGTIKDSKPLSAEEKRALEEKYKAQQALIEKARLASQTEMAKKCLSIWEAAHNPSTDHPYLVKKQIKPYAIRQLRDMLLVPVLIGGKLSSIQFIQASGEKKFKSGATTSGGLCLIGPKPTDQVYICEGYATGASIYEATGVSTVVGFHAGNLKPVAEYVRSKFPDLKIIICADDDRFTKDNPGVTMAANASAAVKGELRRPVFPSDDGKPTDFNDLAVMCGLDEVKHQLTTARPSFEVAETPKAIEARRTIDLMSPFPHMASNGRPLSTIENVKELLERLNIRVQYDVIKKDNRISILDREFLIDTEKNDKMSYISSYATRARMNLDKLYEYVNFIGSQDPCNPVQEWIKSKPWDGEDRLTQFYGTVKGTKDSDPVKRQFKETLIRKWMLSAIAAAYNPKGCSAHGVLVFTGAQNLGKTSWLKSLVPKDLGLVLDGHTLNLTEKDTILTAVSYWLVELGEIDATFRKADIAQLKSFLTKEKDVLRPHYMRIFNEYPRRTVFFGSVNDKDYLHDPTGNRRFWTIECEHVNYAHGFDMQQVWAQLAELYSKGESWVLTKDEIDMLNEHNKDFEAINPIEDQIRDAYEWSMPRTMKFTCAEIAEHLKIYNPQTRDVRAISKAIKDICGETLGKSNGRKVFNMPPARIKL